MSIKKHMYLILLVVFLIFLLTMLIGCRKEKYSIVYENTYELSNSNPDAYTVKTKTINLQGLEGRLGYEFTGWYTESEGGSKVELITKGSSGNKTLYARWEIINYFITYELDGGENNPLNISTFTVLNLESPGVALLDPIKDDEINALSSYKGKGQEEIKTTTTQFKFEGWYKESEYINKVGSFIYELDNLTLFAKWSDETTTVTEIDYLYKRINGSGEMDTSGEYILFGEYPQTIKEDGVEITNDQDSRGYYLGDDNYYYAQVTATPYSSSYSFSTNEKIKNGDVYYFKVEPIKWRILSESNSEALILCKNILTNKQFYNLDSSGNIYDEAGIFANNYWHSDIRAWLNEEFYNMAFNELQQAFIQTTEVENDANSTGYDLNQYACDNTNDKVFLPSYKDMVSTAYGFNSSDSVYDIAKRRFTSDYSRAIGVFISTSGDSYGSARWWLRSPNHKNPNNACSIKYNGSIVCDWLVKYIDTGVVPALTINLS